MWFIVLILINLLIVNMRLWISWVIFPDSASKKIKIILWFLWIILWILLWSYPALMQVINTSRETVTQTTVSIWSTSMLLMYCVILLIALSIITKTTPTKKYLQWVIWITLFLLVSTFIGIQLWIWTIILYYLIVSGSEELLKYFSGSLLAQNTQLKSDIILRSIIIALWFSFIENIFYALPHWDSFLWWLATITNRWAVSFLMHSIFTWTIAYVALQPIWKKIYWLTVACILWVMLHFLYNISAISGSWRIMIWLILWGYIILSYLLYTSDSLYITDRE